MAYSKKMCLIIISVVVRISFSFPNMCNDSAINNVNVTLTFYFNAYNIYNPAKRVNVSTIILFPNKRVINATHVCNNMVISIANKNILAPMINIATFTFNVVFH